MTYVVCIQPFVVGERFAPIVYIAYECDNMQDATNYATDWNNDWTGPNWRITYAVPMSKKLFTKLATVQKRLIEKERRKRIAAIGKIRSILSTCSAAAYRMQQSHKTEFGLYLNHYGSAQYHLSRS